MSTQAFSPSEILQLHEILTLKNLSLTKSVSMSPLISDNELKTILQKNITGTRLHIKELRELMKESPIPTSPSNNQ